MSNHFFPAFHLPLSHLYPIQATGSNYLDPAAGARERLAKPRSYGLTWESKSCWSCLFFCLLPEAEAQVLTRNPSGGPPECSFKKVMSIYFVPFSPGLLIPGASLPLIPYSWRMEAKLVCVPTNWGLLSTSFCQPQTTMSHLDDSPPFFFQTQFLASNIPLISSYQF